MTPKNRSKFLALILAVILCLAVSGCSKDPAATNTAPDTEPNTAQIPTDPIPEGEILPQTETWTARSPEGILDEAASCHIINVESKEDLDPYRSYLTDLTTQDEARILADQKGKCVLLEITSSRDNAFYSVNSVARGIGIIEITVNEEISQEEEPFHTFFLMYFSSEIYRGENIQAVFAN